MKHGEIPNQTIVAIDGKALGYLAFYSSLREYGEGNTENIRLGTICGFLSRLLGISARFKTNRFIFCWDTSPTVRHKLCPEYKKDRYDSEDKRAIQKVFLELETEILPSIGFNNNIKWEGFEADDILATLAKTVKPTTPLVLETVDCDLYQCLASNVVFHSPKRYTGQLMTVSKFIQKYGIQPKQWIEVKSIAGCESDKIAGVPRVGEITALKYLTGRLKKHHKTFFSIVENPAVIQRNRLLVELPHPDAPKSVKLVSNTLTIKKIMAMADKFGFETFKEELLPRWESLINGNY